MAEMSSAITESSADAAPSSAERFAHVLAFLIPAIGVLWAFDGARLVGLLVYKEQYIAVMLGLGLAVGLLKNGSDNRTVSAFFLAGSLVSLAACLWLAYDYQNLLMDASRKTWQTLLLGGILLVAISICVKRTAGWFLIAVLVFFLVQTLYAGYLPQAIQGRSVTWDRLLAYLAVDPTATLGMPLAVTATIVITFVLFGMMIARLGGGDYFTELAMRSVGRYRGGAAKVAVAGSALFGSVSGSAVANIVATGVVTIPLMKRAGYRSEQAGAIEAVASTGGQLLPPIMGAAAFLMAEFLQIPYSSVLLAALIPGLLYYVAVFFYTDLVAARDRITGIDDESSTERRPLLGRSVVYVTPFVVLLVAMFTFSVQPEIAAIYACLALVAGRALTRSGRRMLTPASLYAVGVETGCAMVEIIAIAAAAGVIIGAINLSGSAFALSLVLLKLGGSSILAVLAITAVVSIILGMGMPTVGVYVLLATLAAPALVQLGIEPLAAHLFVLYFGMMSMITPPVAIASYVAASLAGGEPVRTGFEAMRVGWAAYIVPFLFVFSPSLLMQGNWLQIILAVVSAIVGIGLVTAGFVGFLRTRLSIPIRLLAIVSGIMLFVPADSFSGAWVTEIIGIAGLVVLLLIARGQQSAGAPA